MEYPSLQTSITQNPYPPPTDPYPPSTYPSHFTYYPQNPNPTVAAPQSSLGNHELYNNVGLDPALRPPGVDSYALLSSNSHTHLGHEAYAGLSYGHNHMVAVDTASTVISSGYYSDPNAHNWAAREAVRQRGTDPVGYGAGISVPSNVSEHLPISNLNSTWWTSVVAQPHGSGTWKHPKKTKTKIVQSAYCEVCKIDCNSKDVLDQHKLGKKHKKNVEKLREALGFPGPPAASNNSAPRPQEQPNKGKSKKSRKKAAETVEDLETKTRKVLEGGAAAEAVRLCTICNVVCNSELVFNYHLAGQKHAALVKKHAYGT
ncbi:Zinc finger protein like [Quillaja saponaria]|uniref:Zinc finger protein like n=1 Tax=Quillaja saponaria TaxID=32244 RepID=A0AAD7VBZ1_QUISA|nr:Zinc finger protein like [Quillaja saponaria]